MNDIYDTFITIEKDHFTTFSHTITQNDLENFVSLSGDDNPLHMNDEFAARTHFRTRVVHGMIPASFISTVIGTKLPGKGALWQSLTIQFLKPCRVGDTINITATVKHKSTTQRIIVLDILIKNQRDEELIRGEASVKMLKVSPDEIKKEILMSTPRKGTALITGSGTGIGAAIAKKLAADGYDVIINYYSSENEARNVQHDIEAIGRKAIIYRADIANQSDVENMIKLMSQEFDDINVLVNNASGLIIPKKFADLQWEDIQDHINTQVKGMFNLCQLVIPLFLRQGGGNIINITSIYADNAPPPKMYAYTIAKSAMVALSRSLAQEFGSQNIRVNCIAPGMTETKLIAEISERAKLLVEAQSPLKRLAKPDDIAGVVSFLASENARYITGQTIRVCGGQVMV